MSKTNLSEFQNKAEIEMGLHMFSVKTGSHIA
jgi:hypothetical protein